MSRSSATSRTSSRINIGSAEDHRFHLLGSPAKAKKPLTAAEIKESRQRGLKAHIDESGHQLSIASVGLGWPWSDQTDSLHPNDPRRRRAIHAEAMNSDLLQVSRRPAQPRTHTCAPPPPRRPAAASPLTGVRL